MRGCYFSTNSDSAISLQLQGIRMHRLLYVQRDVNLHGLKRGPACESPVGPQPKETPTHASQPRRRPPTPLRPDPHPCTLTPTTHPTLQAAPPTSTPPIMSAPGRAGEVLRQLRQVIDPDFGEDIVACGFVKELAVDEAAGSCRGVAPRGGRAGGRLSQAGLRQSELRTAHEPSCLHTVGWLCQQQSWSDVQQLGTAATQGAMWLPGSGRRTHAPGIRTCYTPPGVRRAGAAREGCASNDLWAQGPCGHMYLDIGYRITRSQHCRSGA